MVSVHLVLGGQHVIDMLNRESAVVLVHDVTVDFIRPDGPQYDPGIGPMLENIKVLLAAARAAHVPVIFAAPRPPGAEVASGESGGGPPHRSGSDIPAELGPQSGERVIRKPRWGAFHGSELEDHLRATHRDTLIICGVSLAGGVETTIRDAFNRELRSLLVADACLARAIPDQGRGAISADEVRRVILSVLAQRFARVVTTHEVCEALRR
jgi:nicotinamidase-related amidase